MHQLRRLALHLRVDRINHGHVAERRLGRNVFGWTILRGFERVGNGLDFDIDTRSIGTRTKSVMCKIDNGAPTYAWNGVEAVPKSSLRGLDSKVNEDTSSDGDSLKHGG